MGWTVVDWTGDGADHHYPAVATSAAFLACHRPAADPARQGPCRFLPAGPQPAGRPATLGALRRVDAMEADPHAVHIERVAIDNPRQAGQRGARRRLGAAVYANLVFVPGLDRVAELGGERPDPAADRAHLFVQPFRNAVRRRIGTVFRLHRRST